MIGPPPELWWRIPVRERTLPDEVVRPYVDGELPLSVHAQWWAWLHGLTDVGRIADRLADEATAYLGS